MSASGDDQSIHNEPHMKQGVWHKPDPSEKPDPFERFLSRPDLGSDDDPPPAWADWPERFVCDGKRSVRVLAEDPEEWGTYAWMWRESFPDITGSAGEFVMIPHLFPSYFGEGDGWMKGLYLAVALVDH